MSATEITVVVQPTAAGYITSRASVKSAETRTPVRFDNSRWTTVRVLPAA